ncbi:putative tetratricopeptide repeat family protein [Botrytis fragariae]|uniref:Putative tetratricopeptide repeat family protein n=1 Tax=Botrytis fragariae TaxID=1964551 RepID=A0A8H6AL15_9HELO|nr:putative tetratricopeptide repeat family protein [Botrytis fragariae]KAF5869225.1 putative tetratricopeptide repeat family protein [Botrytis fragariae]
MSDQTFIENHILMDIEAQSSLPTGGHKILSREEWLKFKPIIQQLYIDENQTYPTVAHELARRFDFYPTKRQFTRKTEEWGLKKNFRKAERKLLLQNDNKNGIVKFVIGDKRVSDTKRIQRLKRRYAHESPLSRVHPDISYQDTNITPKSVGPYCLLEEQLPTSNYVGEIASAHVESKISNVTEENDAMDLEQWPFSWVIGVPGSPGLTGLFRLLEIEASMPPLNLDDEVVDTKQFISGNELRNVIECHETSVKQMSILYNRAEYGYMPNNVVQPVLIPRKEIQWSPLFELDLFPTSQNTCHYRRGVVLAPSSSPLIDVWEKEIKEWKFKLCSFRMTLPDHNPAIILVLQHLIHLHKQKRKTCLRLHRQLLAARLKEGCPNNYKIMEVYFEIVMQLLSKRKVLEATYLYRSLCEAIQQSQLSSEHPFYIRLSYLEAYVLYNNSQYAEAELVIRSVIRNVLNNRDLDRNQEVTSDALELLGLLIGGKKEDLYSEAEKLYRYNIHQLNKHDRSLSKSYFKNMNGLIWVLLKDRKTEEAYSLCRCMMEHVEQALGKRHSWYGVYQRQLGSILSDRGMIFESIEIVHNILQQVDHCLLPERYHNLGSILMNGGSFEEAIVMYKKSLSIDVQQQGWCNFGNLNETCGKLGYCYEELSQFQDALFLYEKLLEKLKSVTEDDNPFIKEVEVWISEVQELMEESSAVCEESNAACDFQMGGVSNDSKYEQFGEGVLDDVSLREIFEMEDRALDEEVADIGKQLTSIKLS